MMFWTVVLVVVFVVLLGAWLADRRRPGRGASGVVTVSASQDEAKAQAARNRQAVPGAGQL